MARGNTEYLCKVDCHHCNQPQTRAHSLPPEPGSSPCQPLIFAAGCSALRPDCFTLEERGPGANEIERVGSRTRVDSLRKTYEIPCSCQKSDSDSSVAHSVPVPVPLPTCTCTYPYLYLYLSVPVPVPIGTCTCSYLDLYMYMYLYLPVPVPTVLSRFLF
jgi:hypothetical protein